MAAVCQAKISCVSIYSGQSRVQLRIDLRINTVNRNNKFDIDNHYHYYKSDNDFHYQIGGKE